MAEQPSGALSSDFTARNIPDWNVITETTFIKTHTICHHVLSNTGEIRTDSRMYHLNLKTWSRKCDLATQLSALNLLCVCRKIYHGAAALPFSANALCYNSWIAESFERFMIETQPYQRAAVRRLIVDPADYEHLEPKRFAFYDAAATEFPNVLEVLVQFRQGSRLPETLCELVEKSFPRAKITKICYVTDGDERIMPEEGGYL